MIKKTVVENNKIVDSGIESGIAGLRVCGALDQSYASFTVSVTVIIKNYTPSVSLVSFDKHTSHKKKFFYFFLLLYQKFFNFSMRVREKSAYRKLS